MTLYRRGQLASRDLGGIDIDSMIQQQLDTYYPMDSAFSNLRPLEADVNEQTRERCRASKWFGKLLIVLTLVSFIFVGLILNCLQFVLMLSSCLSRNERWQNWHKLANGYLIYLIYTQPTFLIYFWTRVDFKIHLADMQMAQDVKKELLAILIVNHTYELDWLICFLMADQIGNIGAYKCFVKDELKWLPVIGWSFWMSDVIFVKRDWQQDRLNMKKKLDELLLYDQILLGIFAEGTRLTKEKYAEAREFARAKNMQPLKYHLFPRARGFNYTVRHYLRAASLEKKLDSVRVFNLQIVLPDKPNFKHFLEGSYIKADIYCEEVSLSEEIKSEAIESEDAEQCPKLTQLLLDIYRRKDSIIEEYTKENGFHLPNSKLPRGGILGRKQPIGPIVYWLIFMSFTYATFTYLALTVFAHSYAFWTFTITTLAIGVLMLRQIERESKPNNRRMFKGTKPTYQLDEDPRPA